MSLRGNILKNGSATSLQVLARVGDQLLLVPFFLTAWGSVYYGEWLTLSAVPALFALGDLGIGTAGANTLVLRYASGDHAGAARAGKTCLWLVAVFGLGAILLCAALLAVVSFTGILASASIGGSTILLCLALLILANIALLFVPPFEGKYRAARHAALGMNLNLGLSLAKTAATIGVLLLGGRIVAIASAYLLITVVFVPIYAAIGSRVLPGLSLRGASLERDELRQMFRKGLSYMLVPGWQAVFFQGTTLVVRATLGPGAVAIFNTVRALCRSLNQLSGVVSGAVFPELQFEFGAGRLPSARRLLRLSVGLVLVGALLAVALLGLVGPSIYGWWTRGELHPPLAVWWILIAGILPSTLWWTAAMVFRAVNRPEGLAFVGLASATISVAISWVLAAKVGLVGVAIGSLVMEIIMAGYVLPTAFSVLGQRMRGLVRDFWADLGSVTMSRRSLS